jgi:hypothetical protein
MLKFVQILYRWKKEQNDFAAFVFFIELPKVNHHPIGKNFPNLVTLIKRAYQGLALTLLCWRPVYVYDK